MGKTTQILRVSKSLNFFIKKLDIKVAIAKFGLMSGMNCFKQEDFFFFTYWKSELF